MYAVVTPDGEIVSVAEVSGEAVWAAQKVAPQVILDDSGIFGREANPPTLSAARGPSLAHAGVRNLKISWRDVERMSFDEAHARLLPLFGALRKRGKAVSLYETKLGMRNGLLGQNYKTSKQFPSSLTKNIVVDVMGLSMLPNVSFSILGGSPKINTCVGATKECKAACLVYSGRNEADKYNAEVKFVRTQALIKEPVAFGRILYEACIAHMGNSAGIGKPRTTTAGAVPFIRLNVFSDVPWELVYPELFAQVPVQFYDYTKVPGRRVPKNYDLTFSYSGRNIEASKAELSHGRRLAVVFFRHHKPGLWKKAPGGFPAKFLGKTVIDGDVHDARPIDPRGVVVGLKYKPPRGAGIDQRHSVFVVEVQEVDGVYVTAVTPQRQAITDADDVKSSRSHLL